MEFFETPEQVAQQLEETRVKLERFGQDASAEEILTRLRATSPYHVTLIIRTVFMVLTVITLVVALGLLALPFIGQSQELVETIKTIERAAFNGAPMPLVVLICAVCMAIAWVTATQAALAFGRECELLPHEKRQHEQLMGEYTRLSGQKAIMERLHGTPMGAAMRSRTPGATPRIPTVPPAPLRTAAVQAARPSMPSPAPAATPRAPRAASRSNSHIGTPTPAPVAAVARSRRALGAAPTAAAAPIGGRAIGGTASVRIGGVPTGGGPVGSPFDDDLNSPVGVAAVAAVPAVPATRNVGGGRTAPWNSQPSVSSGQRSARTPAPAPGLGARIKLGVRKRSPVSLSSTAAPVDDEEAPLPMLADDDSAFDVAEIVDNNPNRYIIDPETSASSGFQNQVSTRFPRWGQVTEPWLEDAIEKAEILARALPMQGSIEFSPDAGLPFALVLERTTPAMAVRCTMSFVEFLASVATPPRARIEFRSVANMDPAFYRNVMSALEPYFGDTCEVTRDAQRRRVEIDFLEPDLGWSDYPYLPIEDR